jgi:hypothetical protein
MQNNFRPDKFGLAFSSKSHVRCGTGRSDWQSSTCPAPFDNLL